MQMIVCDRCGETIKSVDIRYVEFTKEVYDRIVPAKPKLEICAICMEKGHKGFINATADSHSK